MENSIINALETDSDFQELIRRYESPNYFSILDRISKEEDHTKIIKWLLDPSSNHQAGVIPLKLFIDLVNSKIHDEKICVDEVELKKMVFDKEYVISNGRPDIVGQNDSLILVIENKIKASETNYQTDRYYDFFQNEFPGLKKCYIFLKPEAHPVTPKNENFIVITYQELYDYVILPCINNESIISDTKEILEQYSIAISYSNSYNYDCPIINANKDLRNRIFKNNKDAFIKIKNVMKDINRDKSSIECTFYDKYKEYIKMILSDQSFKIVPANEDKKDAYSCEQLVNAGLVHVSKDLSESTELHMERNKIHYVIQIFDQNGTYKCYIGYKKTEDYDYNNDIDAMTDDEGNVMIFSSIHSAAVEAELDAEKKIVEKEKNRPASMNPGKSPKEWILRRAGRPEYEGKKIGEVYKSLLSDLQH